MCPMKKLQVSDNFLQTRIAGFGDLVFPWAGCPAKISLEIQLKKRCWDCCPSSKTPNDLDDVVLKATEKSPFVDGT